MGLIARLARWSRDSSVVATRWNETTIRDRIAELADDRSDYYNLDDAAMVAYTRIAYQLQVHAIELGGDGTAHHPWPMSSGRAVEFVNFYAGRLDWKAVLRQHRRPRPRRRTVYSVEQCSRIAETSSRYCPPHDFDTIAAGTEIHSLLAATLPDGFDLTRTGEIDYPPDTHDARVHDEIEQLAYALAGMDIFAVLRRHAGS